MKKLQVSLVGFLNPLNSNKFEGGLKELPLIGNEAYIITNEMLEKIYNLKSDNSDLYICVGKTPVDSMEVNIDTNRLFSSHIAIFGNTGSGKSNTLAKIYSCLFNHPSIKFDPLFQVNCKFILFDFNGEYSSATCIFDSKDVYKLSTSTENGEDKIKIPERLILDYNFFSIIAEATDKTQKPFIKRALEFYKKVKNSDDFLGYIQNILRNQIAQTLTMADKEKAFLLLDYLKNILPKRFNDDTGELIEVDFDLEWHGKQSKFMVITSSNQYIDSITDPLISTAEIYKRVDEYNEDDILTNIINFLYIQLIYDVLSSRAVNEHIAPVINRLKSKQKDIHKIFEISENASIWNQSNIAIIDMKNINLEMKKIVPLLISKYIYEEHKKGSSESKFVNIIIDEAHNILSRDSFRESESWKDYRLETFEEIIKEGRKFGVFVTISSQRPSDISPTIISQAHNYFIHRLINQNDLKAVETSISYIDKITAESIPTLPIGTCIFNGISTQMPILLSVDKLSCELSPQSETIKISDLLMNI